MEIDETTLDYLSELCQIHCDQDMKKKLQGDLKDILTYVEMLDHIDTEGVAPCSHVLEASNVMREDEIGECMPRKTLLDLAPEHVSGLIRVPTIINKEDS